MSGSFGGSGPSPVQAGGTLIIKFSDPNKAGQTVQVAAHRMLAGDSLTIPIILDEDGNGAVKWLVPEDWGEPFLVLQADDTPDKTIQVT